MFRALALLSCACLFVFGCASKPKELQVEYPVHGHPMADEQIPSREYTLFCREGDFPGHLQGITADVTGIYWSFCDTILKTDWNGKTIVKVGCPRHAGDCCMVDGDLFVALSEGGKGSLCEYDKDLKLLAKHPLPETPAPDGLTYFDGCFYVANDDFGRKPHPFNYIMLYDRQFKFLRKVKVEFGRDTEYGAQNLAVVDYKIVGSFYGDKGQSPFFTKDLRHLKMLSFRGTNSVGLCKVPPAISGNDKTYLVAQNFGKWLDEPDPDHPGETRRRGSWSAYVTIMTYEDGKITKTELPEVVVE